MSSPALTIEVLDETRRLPAAAHAWLTSNAQAALRRLNASGEVRVRVIDDETMARAHEEFAGVPGTTDVLTFDMSDPELSTPGITPDFDQISSNRMVSDSILYQLDTDILVCLDEGERHAAAGRYPVERELLLYVVHGVLHCLGMDDHDEDAAAAMHRMEDALLEAIGVGAVYSSHAR